MEKAIFLYLSALTFNEHLDHSNNHYTLTLERALESHLASSLKQMMTKNQVKRRGQCQNQRFPSSLHQWGKI